jgi:DNA polymerase-1
MQGTAADIIKRAMIDLHGWIGTQTDFDITMIMQVHDELVFEVAEKDLEAVKAPINARMCNAADLKVPLVVDIGTGSNWDEAH